MRISLQPAVATVPPVAAEAAWQHRQRRPSGRSLRRPCRVAAAEGPPGGSSEGSSNLLRRAQQLREARRQLEQEAAALAVAEGLSPAERAALLEAVGLPAPPASQQATEAGGPAVQQGVPSSTQPSAAGIEGAEGGKSPLPGSSAWRAQLSPQLQNFLLDTGLASVLDQQAEAVQKDQEWGVAEEHGGGVGRGSGWPAARVMRAGL